MRVRVTERDPTAAHQIDLRFRSSNNEIIQVFCRCRPEPLGEVTTATGDPWEVYLKRSLHSEHREPFDHKKTWKVYDG